MARQTPILLPPTLDEVKTAARQIGLSEREATRFYNFYECKGWMVGKNKMVSFAGALANWKMTLEDRNGTSHSGFNGADKVCMQKEYDRVLERMRVIRSSYGEMQSWTKPDAAEFEKLRARKCELKKVLGLTI